MVDLHVGESSEANQQQGNHAKNRDALREIFSDLMFMVASSGKTGGRAIRSFPISVFLLTPEEL
ncbi:hypothetical protein HXV84_05475 [Pseudomonas amygdali pv. morsprunorum]|nr:hypothetical protein [Pseudomonas amygdali pv. morsprunorum]